jgi:4-hydroxybenzoyl-CoA thioesterase
LAYLVNRRTLTIEWGHCDPGNIVFNGRYFEFADWSTALLFEAALRMTKPEISERYDADMPLVDVRGRFIKPLTVADEVEIASTIREFRRSSFDVTHRFFNRGELVAEVQETRVWVCFDASDPPKLRPKHIPAEVIERFNAT